MTGATEMNRKHIIAIIALTLCTVLGIVAASALSRDKRSAKTDVPEDFSFAITWNVFGISSYDSATGTLVKTTDATHPEDYVATHYINEKEAGRVWQLIQKLDIESYPDEYDPNPGMRSEPPMTLILTVRTADGEKTVKAEGIAMSYESKDEKGQKFLDTCRAIEEILTDTEEWKALPDYEFLYE